MLFLQLFIIFPFILYHFIEVLQFRAVELSNLLKLLFYVYVFQCWQIVMQIFRNAFSSGLQLSVPFHSIKVFRKGKFIHNKVILHENFTQQYLLNSQKMQTFKQISYQNYIQLRFNQKNLQETEQQQALLKYKRNAQLLAQIFSFQRKPKPSFKAVPVITQQHLDELEREVEKEKLEGEAKCKEIQQKSNNYCRLLKKIKQIKTEEERIQIIEELKQSDLYDEKHPYFTFNSPFYLNNTDEQVLEVTSKFDLPDETGMSLTEIK